MVADLTNRLIARLGSGVASASELEQALGQSQSSVSRALRKLTEENKVLRIGVRRGTRYGLRRAVDGIGSQWPLRRVDPAGAIHDLGTLHSLAADQYFFDPAPEALADGFAYGGIGTGIPYFLQDQRPAGFLGRAVPQRYPELNLPQRTIDGTDEHYLRYLTQRGADAVGDLILGKDAFDRYLQNRQPQSVIPDRRDVKFPAGLRSSPQPGQRLAAGDQRLPRDHAFPIVGIAVVGVA